MEIRSKPFERIVEDDVRALVTGGVFEDRTLEFKSRLNLDGDQQRAEFLKDLSAFANASGGTIVYGIEEGSGDNQGRAVNATGLRLSPEETHQLIENLLRDGVDPRIPSVLHKAVRASGDSYFYVVRVAGSALAPHMVMLPPLRYRFFQRLNTSVSTMSASQISELVLRARSAMDRAEALVAKRQKLLQERGMGRMVQTAEGSARVAASQAILHVVPLFPLENPWNLGIPEAHQRLQEVKAFGATSPYSEPRFTAEGLYNILENMRHVVFLRSGAVEFQRFDVVQPGRAGELIFKAWDLEWDIVEALEECMRLTEDGLLPLPATVQLALISVDTSQLFPHPHADQVIGRPVSGSPLLMTPRLMTEWGETAAEVTHRMFDEIWQSWGTPRCSHYDESGNFRFFVDAKQSNRRQPFARE